MKRIVVIIISIIIIVVASFIFINVYEDKVAPEKTVNELFNNVCSGNMYEANMMFISNYNNKLNIEQKYEKGMNINQKTDIGYTEYLSSEKYMIEYFKHFTYNIESISKATNNIIIVNVKIRKPCYEKYINLSFNITQDENVKNSEFKFIDYMNSNDIEYEEKSGFFNIEKINNDWRIQYEDNILELFY